MTKSMGDSPPHILVVDDEQQNRELIEAILLASGYEVSLAGGGEEGLAAAHEKTPDLMILDLMMPGLSGFEVCARVKTDPQTSGIPVLFVTALSQLGDKERALAAGGDDFLTKPFQRAELLTRVEALLKVRHLNRNLERALAYLHALELARHADQPRKESRLPPPEPASGVVLVVDDELLPRQLYADVLREEGYVVLEAENGPQALEIARQETIDVVLLDIMMPGMSGLEVLSKLGELVPDSPVVIVTAHPTSDNAIAALRLGAFDFIVKGFKNQVMLTTVARALDRRRLTVRNRGLIRQLEAKVQELLAILAEHARQSGRGLRLQPEE
ncbi:MAG: response regulator [candidate division NC10 bacterium]|nr:response regulator [candidate division NC10 bacterium]